MLNLNNSIQIKPIKLKVFIEGIDVTERVSRVDGLRYEINTSTNCSIFLENIDNDFIITLDDLEKIKDYRLGSSSKKPVFENKYKDYFLDMLLDLKVPGVDEFENNEVYLYEFGLFSCIIPLWANVRIFCEYPDPITGNPTWFFLFSGVVINRSFSYELDGRISVSVACADVLHFLKMSEVSNSLAVWENNNKAIGEYLKRVKSYLTDKKIGMSSFTDGFFYLPDVKFDISAFGFGKVTFLGALRKVVYGDVEKDDYGKDIRTIVLDFKWKDFYNLLIIKRNCFAAGLFDLAKFEVAYPEGDSEVLKIIEDEGARLISTDKWESIVGNEVLFTDLIDLSADISFGESLYNEVKNNISIEDVVQIIGQNTKTTGLYNVSAGGLKVLLPKGLEKSVYNLIYGKDTFANPGIEEFGLVSRYQILLTILTSRTDYIFYATPKGHIVCEMPQYDVDFLGEKNWRKFTRNDLVGSYSDNINVSSLYSASVVNPEIVAMDMGTIESNSNKALSTPITPNKQGCLSPTLLTKFGLRIIRDSSLFRWIPVDIDGAIYKSELVLSIENRRGYTASVSIIFNPRIMINRQIEISDLGRRMLVLSQNSSLSKDSSITTVLNCSFVRELSYRGLYDVAFGEKLSSLSIDYNRISRNPKQEKESEKSISSSETEQKKKLSTKK